MNASQHGGSFTIHNRWTKGAATWKFPPLPPHIRGQVGCRVDEGIFDTSVGREVFLLIVDDPIHARELARLKPFELYIAPAFAETSHGKILFLLFSVRSKGREVVAYELLLNPYESEMVKRLAQWSRQTHVKVFLVDNQTGEELRWYEFKNTFEMHKLAPAVEEIAGSAEPHDFMLAREEFYRDYDVDKFVDTIRRSL